MQDSSPRWLERRYGTVAVVTVAVTLALVYLAVHGRFRGDLYSVFGWAAAFAPPVFIGIVAGLGRPRTAVRHALYLTGITLLLIAPIFGEGFFCVLMMSPVYLLVTPVVAILARAVLPPRSLPVRLTALLLPWVAFVLDRPVPVSALPVNTVSDAVILQQSPEEVWAALDRLELKFDDPPASYMRWGLPTPRALHAGGVHVGARRRLVFDNGVLVGRVTASTPARSFTMVLEVESSGTEFFDHWAALEDTVFELERLADGGTRLVHTTRYRRLVRPQTWFRAWESHVAHILQAHLLEAFVRQSRHDLDAVALR